ncbi:MAG: DUF5606 domain-containing protein [Saprospiraceae bacterium]|nr:DUF5606 domain-containing protein [Saprospiraceae bacterium]MDW8229727.1 DUF5606 domain-containing protein [Saprospiraceae bacterium]
MALNLEKYLVISGVPGVHRLISARTNGVLVEDFKEKRARFVAVRQNQVMPLATISVYTDTEEGTVPLAEVFQRMFDAREQTPPPPTDAPGAALREYFAQVLPEHDQDRVHIADIKKCIRWFNYMLEHGIFDQLLRETETTQATEKKPETADNTDTPSLDETIA